METRKKTPIREAFGRNFKESNGVRTASSEPRALRQVDLVQGSACEQTLGS